MDDIVKQEFKENYTITIYKIRMPWREDAKYQTKFETEFDTMSFYSDSMQAALAISRDESIPKTLKYKLTPDEAEEHAADLVADNLEMDSRINRYSIDESEYRGEQRLERVLEEQSNQSERYTTED
jgi:hypothetical protein